MNLPPNEQIIPDLTMVRFVLMDIDGTLVFGSDQDLQNVQHQLARLRRSGVEFSVATGRTICGARKVLNQLDKRQRVEWIIAYNGAVIARPDASPWIDRCLINPSNFLELLEVCRDLKMHALAYTCENQFALRSPENVFAEPEVFPEQREDFNGMIIRRVNDLTGIAINDVVAVLLTPPIDSQPIEDLAVTIRKRIGDALRVTTSGGKYVEIANSSSTKKLAMERLCHDHGIEIEQVMAIGDNYNDTEMLSTSGFGVAVANSPQEVQQVSRIVCRHSGAAGVTEILREVAEAYREKKRRGRIERDAQ